jgi:hypothetical protein
VRVLVNTVINIRILWKEKGFYKRQNHQLHKNVSAALSLLGAPLSCSCLSLKMIKSLFLAHSVLQYITFRKTNFVSAFAVKLNHIWTRQCDRFNIKFRFYCASSFIRHSFRFIASDDVVTLFVTNGCFVPNTVETRQFLTWEIKTQNHI